MWRYATGSQEVGGGRKAAQNRGNRRNQVFRSPIGSESKDQKRKAFSYGNVQMNSSHSPDHSRGFFVSASVASAFFYPENDLNVTECFTQVLP